MHELGYGTVDRFDQGVAVDLGEVAALFVDVGGLQRLPAAFRTVVSEIGGDQVGMELRIDFPAGVVPIGGDHQIAGRAVFIRAVLPHPRPRQAFHLCDHFRQRLRVGIE